MATAVLGKVCITPKGNYVSGTTYARLDAVYDATSNASYLSLKSSNTAALANDGVNWMYLCRGLGVMTDNNFTNAEKAKVDAAVPQSRTIAGLALNADITIAQLISAGLCQAPESGTWTPTVYGATTAGSPTFSVAPSGIYYKIGKLVFLMFRFTFSSLGGMAGLIRLVGLPFAIQDSGTIVVGETNNQNVKLTGSIYGTFGELCNASLFTDTTAIYLASGVYVCQ